MIKQSIWKGHGFERGASCSRFSKSTTTSQVWVTPWCRWTSKTCGLFNRPHHDAAIRKVEQVNVDKRNAQYLYDEGDSAVFMDLKRTIQPLHEQLGDDRNYLVEKYNITLNFVNGDIIGVELPVTVEMTVAETEPMINDQGCYYRWWW